MFVKQWLREFLAIDWVSSRDRLRARQYRTPGLEKWKVFEIAAALPLLLHLSLALFFVGLCFFTAAIDNHIGQSTLPLVCAWGVFVLATIVAPLVSPRCPFKIRLLKSAMQAGRTILRRPLATICNMHIKKEEMTVVKSDAWQDDLDILFSLDQDMGRDDEILTMIWSILNSSNPSPQVVMDFLLGVLSCRSLKVSSGDEAPSRRGKRHLSDVFDTSGLSRASWSMAIDIASTLLQQPSSKEAGNFVIADWTSEAIYLLLSPASPAYAFPPSVFKLLSNEAALRTVLSVIMEMKNVPYDAIGLISQAFLLHTSSNVHGLRFTASLTHPLVGLDGLQVELWQSLTRAAVHIVRCNFGRPPADHHVQSVLALVLSTSTRHPLPSELKTVASDDTWFLSMLRCLHGLKQESPEARIASLSTLLSFRSVTHPRKSGSPAFPWKIAHQPLPADALHIIHAEANAALADGWQYLQVIPSAPDPSMGLVVPSNPAAAQTPSVDPKPQWAVDAVATLLLTLPSTEIGSIESSLVLRLSSALRDPAASSVLGFRACYAAHGLAKHIQPVDKFDFVPMSEQLIKIVKNNRALPCGISILALYATLLRGKLEKLTPSGLSASQSPWEWPLWMMLKHHREFLAFLRVQPIVDDLWTYLAASTQDHFLVPQNAAVPDTMRSLLEFALGDKAKREVALTHWTSPSAIRWLTSRDALRLFASVHRRERIIDVYNPQQQQFLVDVLVNALSDGPAGKIKCL